MGHIAPYRGRITFASVRVKKASTSPDAVRNAAGGALSVNVSVSPRIYWERAWLSAKPFSSLPSSGVTANNPAYGDLAPTVSRSANFAAAIEGDSITPSAEVGGTSRKPFSSGTLAPALGS